MVRTTSNCNYDTSLDVSLTCSGPPSTGCKWYISITTHGFPDSNVITVIKPSDQQLVEFAKIIEEFADSHWDDYKLEVADLLESLAKRIRGRVIDER